MHKILFSKRRPLVFTLAACALVSLSSCSTPFRWQKTVHPNENAVLIKPSGETRPITSNDLNITLDPDSETADDPAIWVNTTNPELSLILGTDKQAGLGVYDLSGNLIQFIERGRLNNVDVRQEVLIDSQTISLAVATNRTDNSLDIFSISNSGFLRFEYSQPLSFSDPYGVCMSKDMDGNIYAFVNDKSGEYQQWLINRNNKIEPALIGSFYLATQPEGCVVQDSTQTLYLGEEVFGVWKMPADASRSNEITLFDTVNNGRLVEDVEGMDIYIDDKGQDWLVVSSQGDYSYAVYDLTHDKAIDAYLGSFRIVDNIEQGIDGAEETDGLAISSANLGGLYLEGLLVVQDGFNRLPDENQNYKLISWDSIRTKIK